MWSDGKYSLVPVQAKNMVPNEYAFEESDCLSQLFWTISSV
jgi:hypothetical protein